VDPKGNILPDMATSWDVKDEGRTYVFHLHQGIKFHDGTAADAEAIKWSIEYTLGLCRKFSFEVIWDMLSPRDAE
jgi:peptide/nickel transport system substrate-binding protein